MSDMQAPTLPNGTVLSDLTGVQAASQMMRAIESCATKAAGDERAAEVKDYAAAALSFAQAIITLDPSRLAGGDTPQARKDSMHDPAANGNGSAPATKDGDHDGQIGA